MGNDNISNNKSILQRCEDIKNIVINRVERKCIQSIRTDIKDDAIANDCREEFVFPAENKDRNAVSIIVSLFFVVLFVALLIFSISIIVFSVDYRLYGLGGAAIALTAVIINIVLIYKAISTIQFNKRYSKYYVYLKNKKCALTEDISRLFNSDKSIVIKDLKKALDFRYIPQGQLVNEDKMIVFSADSFAEYSKRKNEIDAKINILLQENKNEDSEYAKIIKMIESTVDLLRGVKKQYKKAGIKKELDIMERILMTIKYSNDLIDDDQETISTFVNCYCTCMERIIESYIEVETGKNHYSKEAYLEGIEERREALEYVNDAFENILSDYYAENSII